MSRPSRGPRADRRPRGFPPRKGPRLPRPISAAREAAREPEPSPGPVRRVQARRVPAQAKPAKAAKAAKAAKRAQEAKPARPGQEVRLAKAARPAQEARAATQARGRAPARRGPRHRVPPVRVRRDRVRPGRAARGQVPGQATTRSARPRPAWAPRPRLAARVQACQDPAQDSVTVLVSRPADQEAIAGRRVPAARVRRTVVRAGPAVPVVRAGPMARVRAVRVPAAPGRAR
jgi:hypothetical protein